MPSFSSDGIRIAYLDEGEGVPVLLIHGFASSARVNWLNPGWIATLNRAGYRAIAVDNRGHGDSEKLYDPAAYDLRDMAGDARRLLDHLGIPRAAVIGYSMGARITAFLTVDHPERVSAAVLGGMGYGLVTGFTDGEEIAAALEAPAVEEAATEKGQGFRRFADRTGSDRRALAACMRAPRETLTGSQLVAIDVPVLIAVGSNDEIAGPPDRLARLLPAAEVLDIPDRDHMTAVGDRVFKQGVLAFFARHGIGGTPA